MGGNASTHFHLTNLRAQAKKLAGHIRDQWGVEHVFHWCLGMSFREDQNRTQDTSADASVGVVRRVPPSLRKQSTKRGSTEAKRVNAAADKGYLDQVSQDLQRIRCVDPGGWTPPRSAVGR